MILVELKCPTCGQIYEEFIKPGGELPKCKECGSLLERKWSGKCNGYSAKGAGGGCSGNCTGCKGCH